VSPIKQKWKVFAIAVLLLTGFYSQAQADSINGATTGLSSPTSTITFSEIPLPDFSAIGTNYAGLGVSFSASVIYVPATFALNAGPNFSEPAAGNPSGDGHWLITFNRILNAVAFAYASDPSTITGGEPTTTTFTALRNGAIVEQFSASTDFGPNIINNIFGFQNILFDQVQIDAVSNDFVGNAIDNLQFSAVPEPSTFILLGIGIVALSLIGRRKELSRSSSN
jgi:hypothetical protein